jgi:feruloyl esterase
MKPLGILHILGAPALALCISGQCSAATCESLATLKLNQTTITAAHSEAAGPFTPPSGSRVEVSQAFCRVTMVLRPSADSDIQTEIWLPASGWNGKFQGIGNGGFAGAIAYSGLADAVSNGYAAAATDTGHRGRDTDASWALNHPEKIIDFGHRAIHETAVRAKAVINAFYGEGPKHSYFNSCSDGGREALMEAQRYPADYDGIIAGAPANYWTHLLPTAVFNMQATSAPDSYIPASKLRAIEAAALAVCDSLDGVKDGVIEDPAQCRFDPSVLLCKGAESDVCLTEPQIAALRKIYNGPKNSKGETVMPGFSPGGEAEPGGWAAWITGNAPGQSLQYAFGTNFFKYMVFNDPAWDYKISTVDQNVRLADSKLGGILNATGPDLKKFRDRGGKLILYHGWSDAAIPALSTIDYYQSVQKKLGAKETAAFVRLFMVPGMEHCGGGAGPSAFGQSGVPRADAGHDIDAALERWVEHGVAPEQIIATKFRQPSNPAAGVERTRPLCAYPKTAHWTGTGSTDDAANFICK